MNNVGFVLGWGEYVTPIYPKWEGGYEDVRKFQKHPRGTAAWMKIPAMATKGCCETEKNDTLLYWYLVQLRKKRPRSWWLQESIIEGLAKTIPQGSLSSYIRKVDKILSGEGSYLFMKSTPRVTVGRPSPGLWGTSKILWRVLGYIATEVGTGVSNNRARSLFIYISFKPSIL